MSSQDLQVLDTLGTSDWISGELSDDGTCTFMICVILILLVCNRTRYTTTYDPTKPGWFRQYVHWLHRFHLILTIHIQVLPSQVHPSYPYGNPTNIRHPAARPRPPYDPTSRALFEDMGYAGGGINGALRWRDLALDVLLPVDEEKEEAQRAAQARKMASGATTNQPPVQPQQQQMQQDQIIDEDDEDDDDDENDENDLDDEEEEEDEGSYDEDDWTCSTGGNMTHDCITIG